MPSTAITTLTKKAQQIMTASTDPIHDIHHVTRVVRYADALSRDLHLNETQTQALLLAAWWHDASRTLTKRPSMVLMPLVDDMLSAYMLWRESIRCRMFGPVIGMATRMILCKSMGTGKIFSRIFMRKQNRIMIDALKDADMLDTLSIERTQQIYQLVDSSRVYFLGYKISIWWFLSSQKLTLKTKEAKKYLIQLLKAFVEWIQKPHVFEWHVARFGKQWTYLQIKKGEQFLLAVQQSV